MIIWTPSSPDVFQQWVDITAGDMPKIRVACVGCTDQTPAHVRIPSPLQAPSPEDVLQEQGSAMSNASGSSQGKPSAVSLAFTRLSPGLSGETLQDRPVRQRRVPARMRRSLSKVSEQYSDRSISPASSQRKPVCSPARHASRRQSLPARSAPLDAATNASESSGAKRARVSAAQRSRQDISQSPRSDRSSLTPQRRPTWNSSCSVRQETMRHNNAGSTMSSKRRISLPSAQLGAHSSERRRLRGTDTGAAANVSIGQESHVSFRAAPVNVTPPAAGKLQKMPAVAPASLDARSTAPARQAHPPHSPSRSATSQHSSQLSGPSGLSRPLSSSARGSTVKARPATDEAQDAESAASLAINHTKCAPIARPSCHSQ